MNKIHLAHSLPISVLLASSAEAMEFRTAKPMWPTGREVEKNLSVGFRAVFEAPGTDRTVLRLAASTIYRAYVNGEFCGCGPARGPHGFYRIDEWDITNRLKPGKNLVVVEVAGYNANSYYLLDQPSFLQAEIVCGPKILASTCGDGVRFEAIVITERLQKVQRYSFQRPFSEAYRLTSNAYRWRSEIDASTNTIACSVMANKRLLPRRVPYPRFALRQPVRDVSQGTVKTGQKADKPWKDRSLTGVGPKLGGFPEKELEVVPSLELQTVANKTRVEIDRPLSAPIALDLGENTYHVLDLGTNLTGFLGATLTCHKKTRLFFTFDEILSNGDVDFKRMGCVNIVAYDIEPGTYHVESFEPYTLRYLKVIVLQGGCRVENIYLREYANPDVWEAHFAASDERLNRLYAAARETYAQNAVDIFMDCPSRERAGWLCDSYFTSRVAFDLSGNTTVEKNFFENFLLPARFEHLPEGMLPMCYPSDHNDGVFIPNWAMWFVVQLEEYLKRSGDTRLVKALEPKMEKLFAYFKRFRNEDGLLEKLESWIFVEWSKANEFLRDVSYPTNMLYASTLAAAGRMYNRPEYIAEAQKIREVIRKQSFDGTFFVDNAVRKDGKLEVTRNRSEVCQYFAFFFDVATPHTHAALWQTLCEKFGPRRKENNPFPEVHMANAFVGNQIRLELLSRYGRCQQLLRESVDYCLYMAERTGTLWENVDAGASCNHGFASHAAHALYRDVLGIHAVDPVNNVVQLRFTDVDLAWCEGRRPVPTGAISLRWWREGTKIAYRVDVPAGYSIQVENLSGKELVRRP